MSTDVYFVTQQGVMASNSHRRYQGHISQTQCHSAATAAPPAQPHLLDARIIILIISF